MKNKLRKLRLEKGLSQENVALELGITQKAYSDIENGKTYLKKDSILKLVSLYDVPINELCNLSCHCDAIMKLEKILKYLKDNNIDLPESYF